VWHDDVLDLYFVLVPAPQLAEHAPHAAHPVYVPEHWLWHALHEVDVWSWSPLVWHDDVRVRYFVFVPVPHAFEHAPHAVHAVYVP